MSVNSSSLLCLASTTVDNRSGIAYYSESWPFDTGSRFLYAGRIGEKQGKNHYSARGRARLVNGILAGGSESRKHETEQRKDE